MISTPNMVSTSSQLVSGSKLLDGKVAVVYGAAGGVGRSVARTFAREGATVFLAGRTESSLNSVAEDISTIGKKAFVSKLDALDPKSVETHLNEVVAKKGKIDISFNLISSSYGIGTRLIDLPEERFSEMTFKRVRSYFLTMTSAARIMEKQGHGVILGLTAPNGRLPRANMGGFAIGNAAIEALCRQLALEVGPKGVRVVCIRTGGTPDNPVIHDVFTHLAKIRGTTFQAISDAEAQVTALKRMPLLQDLANAAALIASDYAGAITATTVNASNGELVD